MIRGRLRRRGRAEGPGRPDDEFVEIDPSELTGVFAAPTWLRDVGFTAWLLVGVALFLAGAIALLALTQVIVIPVIVAAVMASVASPLVRWLQSHGLPRPAGAGLLLLGIIVLGAGIVVVILTGITSQFSDLSGHLSDAKDTITGWLKDIGVDPTKAENAKNDASSSTSSAVTALLDGLGAGINALTSLVFFLAMTVLSLFFLLSDGPKIRTWGERHVGLPVDVAHTITQRMLEALRGYFLGVTIVAAFNGVVVMLGALILGVPLAATLGAVTFFAAFIPYLGAWTAGAFSVLIALGGAGTDAAAGMIVVQLLANGVLQQLVQPFAMGAALGIHPLAVLVVTIAGGALFGAVGLILAAPVTAAVVKISADLSRARAGLGDSTEATPPAPQSATA